MSCATIGPIPGVSAICSGVAASSASTVRKRVARLRPVTYPTPSIPTANSTLENGRSREASIDASRRSTLTGP